jgi:hypothetical protein
MMTASNEFAQYLRTLVRGQTAENDRIEARLDAAGWVGYPQFLAVAFFLAVERRFQRPADPGEIIRFVADIRASLADGGPDIDPDTAERMIRSVLDERVRFDMSALNAEMVGRIQSAVVYAVLTEADLADPDLDQFLAEAERLASSH